MLVNCYSKDCLEFFEVLIIVLKYFDFLFNLPGKEIAFSLSMFKGVISGVSFILLLLIDSEMFVCLGNIKKNTRNWSVRGCENLTTFSFDTGLKIVVCGSSGV